MRAKSHRDEGSVVYNSNPNKMEARKRRFAFYNLGRTKHTVYMVMVEGTKVFGRYITTDIRITSRKTHKV
jgi:hypothetical protein